MHKLHELKDTLCNQLEEYVGKELTAGTLDVVDKLSHTIKNLDKIIDRYEEEESSYDSYGAYRGSYGRNRMAYARGRKRDSMGRYSSEDGYSSDMMAELHELMNNAPDERTRMEFKKFIQKMEQ